jgi:hypothetical protein
MQNIGVKRTGSTAIAADGAHYVTAGTKFFSSSISRPRTTDGEREAPQPAIWLRPLLPICYRALSRSPRIWSYSESATNGSTTG